MFELAGTMSGHGDHSNLMVTHEEMKTHNELLLDSSNRQIDRIEFKDAKQSDCNESPKNDLDSV